MMYRNKRNGTKGKTMNAQDKHKPVWRRDMAHELKAMMHNGYSLREASEHVARREGMTATSLRYHVNRLYNNGIF
jgi:hypothetical protein